MIYRAGFNAAGSIQHSTRAHGWVLVTSGGSTPTFRQITKATLTVFILSRIRQPYDGKIEIGIVKFSTVVLSD